MVSRPKKTTVKFINSELVDANFKVQLTGTVNAGFPSPATDYLENELNFKELFIRNESATIFVRVAGNSMINAGIFNDDILVVDKSLEPADNSVLICYIDNEFTVKKVKKIKGALYLLPENPEFEPIKIKEGSDFRIWGVVTFSIHKHR
jgi:DNA polymerase V